MKIIRFMGFICIILIFLTSITAICAEENSTILEDGFTDLQTKINQTSENGVLELEEDYDIQGSSEKDNNLNIEKNITIKGNGKIIRQSQSLINISDCEATFRDLTFNGAVISASNSRVCLINCTFMNTQYALYYVNGTLKNDAYAIIMNGGNLDIINSTVTNIQKSLNINGDLNIINSSFTKSSSILSAQNARIFNSTFTDLDYISIFAMNLDLRKSRIINDRHHSNFETLGNVNYISSILINILANGTITDNIFINSSACPLIKTMGNDNRANYITIENNIIISEATSNAANPKETPFTVSYIEINCNEQQKHRIGLEYYAYKVSVTDIRISNNFFGFNIEDSMEFYINKQVQIKTEDSEAIRKAMKSIIPVKVTLEKSDDQFILKFTDSDGNMVNLPECIFSLKDMKTGQIIASNITVRDGQAILSLPNGSNPEDILILNCLSDVANKPKPNLTMYKTGTTYLDTVVSISLKNASQPLADANIMVMFNKYDTKTKKTQEGFYYVETIADGTQICDGKTKYRDGAYWSNVIDNPEFDTVTITVLYSSKEFGPVKQSVTCRPSCIEAYLTLKPSSRPYNPNPKPNDQIKIDGIQLTYDKHGYHEPALEYLLYKGNKLIYKNEYVFNIDGNYYIKNNNMPKLNGGIYKVVIRDLGNSLYTFKSKTTTLEITKIKALVKAPKIIAKLKKSKYFKVTVKSNNRALKYIKIKVKVYTGKKAKTYTLKTNKKGVASLNTKKLKKGKHKVVISSDDVNYKISAKSKITIR